MAMSAFELVETSSKILKVDLQSKELASFVDSHNLDPHQVAAIAELFQYLEEKKHQTVIDTLLRLSRLPVKVPKTFDNYDFDRIHGKDSSSVRNLPVLSEVHSGKNIAFIGPPGVGKTHLAEAYGRACCIDGMKAYFLKASELKEKFIAARRYGRESSVINSLVKPTCLIIDEVGRCVFDKESTNMFFDMVDRRYEKEGPKCMIFTSNRQPNDWQEFFRGRDDLNAALDRLFDDAKVITIKGKSYRGRKCEVLAVEAHTEAEVNSKHDNT